MRVSYTPIPHNILALYTYVIVLNSTFLSALLNESGFVLGETGGFLSFTLIFVDMYTVDEEPYLVLTSEKRISI